VAANAGADLAAAAEVNAAICGSLPALLQLFNGTRNAKGAVPGRAAQIRGDAEIANRYRELFLLARPDPEEELSRWIGDLPARRLSQFAARALGAARRVRRTAGENIAEYLQEEGRDLVNKTELEEFLRGVDSLRDTADRVDARLKQLEQHIKGAA
jgi:ubiquinone biosynthesis protein UbiJ